MGEILRDQLVIDSDTKNLMTVRDFVGGLVRRSRLGGEEENKVIDRPIDMEPRIVFVPFSAIDIADIIVEGTKQDTIDKNAQREAPVDRTDLRRR